MALTDHDTLAGLDEAKFTARQQGIELVAGVEISCQWGKQEVHLVGLNIDVANLELQALLTDSQQRRRQRLDKILQKLQPLGIDGLAEAVDAEVGHAVVRAAVVRVVAGARVQAGCRRLRARRRPEPVLLLRVGRQRPLRLRLLRPHPAGHGPGQAAGLPFGGALYRPG